MWPVAYTLFTDQSATREQMPAEGRQLSSLLASPAQKTKAEHECPCSCLCPRWKPQEIQPCFSQSFHCPCPSSGCTVGRDNFCVIVRITKNDWWLNPMAHSLSSALGLLTCPPGNIFQSYPPGLTSTQLSSPFSLL